MVLKKRQHYGFPGFHVPFIPKAPRSARGRGLYKRKVEDDQICAFELLASLAGKLLQESESSASSNTSEANDQLAIGDDVIKQEQAEAKLLKTDYNDQGSCEESVFIPKFAAQNSNQKCLVKEFLHTESDSILKRSSAVTSSGSSEKVNGKTKSAFCKSETASESGSLKVEDSPDLRASCDGAENGFSRQREPVRVETGGLTINNTCSSNDPVESCKKFPALINSDNNVKFPSCREPVPNSSILRHRDDAKVVIRDDDENFSRFNKSCTKPKAYRPPPRIGDRRIRKLLTSKYWKVAPKLKDCEHSKVAFLDGGTKPLYRKRKICYSRERYQYDTLCKRRKLSDRRIIVTSDGGLSSESVCNSPEKGIVADKNGLAAALHGGHQASFHSNNSHVKFRIKSFRVPELFIKVSETATVGSLKRMVMEAVTAILGGSLRVGVLLHGKRVRDDNRTLLQTGITSEENLDTLGFTLDPTPVQVPPPVSTEVPDVLLPHETSLLTSRFPDSPIIDSGIADAVPDPPALTDSGNNIASNQESVPSHDDILADKALSDSRALIAVPPVSAEALAVVPVNHKSRQSELVQRRTRRPFSVSEVEALVQAVEELGTGRWRDVKLRSFENADHRTYVDLKDKWKTLVHTAKIAPQQRRGEPVPQELLDRVLAAHAYWSQHQAKQHGKNQKVDTHPIRNGSEGISTI